MAEVKTKHTKCSIPFHSQEAGLFVAHLRHENSNPNSASYLRYRVTAVAMNAYDWYRNLVCYLKWANAFFSMEKKAHTSKTRNRIQFTVQLNQKPTTNVSFALRFVALSCIFTIMIKTCFDFSFGLIPSSKRQTIARVRSPITSAAYVRSTQFHRYKKTQFEKISQCICN